MARKNSTLVERFKRKNPKIYETIKVFSALSLLAGILMPTFMWADSNKITNIHSGRQIAAFYKLEELKEKSPLFYKALQNEFNVNIEYCIGELEVLDMHNPRYYECKKVANKLKKYLDRLN